MGKGTATSVFPEAEVPPSDWTPVLKAIATHEETGREAAMALAARCSTSSTSTSAVRRRCIRKMEAVRIQIQIPSALKAPGNTRGGSYDRRLSPAWALAEWGVVECPLPRDTRVMLQRAREQAVEGSHPRNSRDRSR